MGHNIVAPNVIWYANFQAHVEIGGKGGGKGGGGKTGKTGSSPNYVYTADIIMGICEGPIAGVGKVWQTSPDAVQSRNAWALAFSMARRRKPSGPVSRRNIRRRL